MLRVHTAGYELRAFFGDGPQQSFPAFVDECDVVEVDNAGALVVAPVRSLPGCSQFADPRPDQASLHDPSPICCRLRDGDLQHVYLSGPPKRDLMLSSVPATARSARTQTIQILCRSAGRGTTCSTYR